MTLEMLDQIEVDESHAEEIPMPHIQWLNGKGKAFAKLNPVIANGGLNLTFAALRNITHKSAGVADQTTTTG